MAFLTQSLMYLVVIFLACIFFVLAHIVNSLIHSFLSRSSFGGVGMLVWVWLFNSSIIGCIH